MRTRTLHAGSDVRVVEYVCSARRGDRPFQEAHGATSIALVRRGVFTYRTEDTRAVLGPGDFLLGNAQQTYECSHEHTDGDVCLCFAFSEAALESVASGLNVAKPRFDAARGLGRRTLSTKAIGALDSASAEEVGLALLGSFLTEPEVARTAQSSSREQRRLGNVIAFIDAHFDEPLRLSELASLARLSSYHFLRVFRAHVGMTPHQYLTRVRLVRCAEQLLASDESVTRIAYASGFRDLSHFNHVFKAEFGKSPRAFRAARNPKSGITQAGIVLSTGGST